jgi:hypothetical protein
MGPDDDWKCQLGLPLPFSLTFRGHGMVSQPAKGVLIHSIASGVVPLRFGPVVGSVALAVGCDFQHQKVRIHLPPADRDVGTTDLVHLIAVSRS